ncbi:hypothetical protein N9937_02070 [bacterium]|nr:hypothetical protein [bacterium]
MNDMYVKITGNTINFGINGVMGEATLTDGWMRLSCIDKAYANGVEVTQKPEAQTGEENT